MKILVADDHELFAEGMRYMLNGLGGAARTVHARDADTALQLLVEDEEIELLLLDLGLPGMDGLSLLRALRGREVDVPVIIVSATESPQDIRQALAAGALGFIPKSHSAGEMLAAIRTVLDGNIYLPVEMQACRGAAAANGDPALPSGRAKEYGITQRQLEVLCLAARGFLNKQIALTLNIGEPTVKAHLGAVFQALKVHNRTECVQKARALGLFDDTTLGSQ